MFVGVVCGVFFRWFLGCAFDVLCFDVMLGGFAFMWCLLVGVCLRVCGFVVWDC